MTDEFHQTLVMIASQHFRDRGVGWGLRKNDREQTVQTIQEALIGRGLLQLLPSPEVDGALRADTFSKRIRMTQSVQRSARS